MSSHDSTAPGNVVLQTLHVTSVAVSVLATPIEKLAPAYTVKMDNRRVPYVEQTPDDGDVVLRGGKRQRGEQPDIKVWVSV